jgi:hypothetical protein
MSSYHQKRQIRSKEKGTVTVKPKKEAHADRHEFDKRAWN